MRPFGTAAKQDSMSFAKTSRLRYSSVPKRFEGVRMSFLAAANKKAIEIGKLSVEMTTAAGSGHPSSSLSLAHLVTVLMYHQMRWDPKDPWDAASDRLVLSEGHAVPIIYAAMADLGVAIGKNKAEARPMTREDAMKLRAIESPIDGHPNPALGVHFFDAATGSLGQ